MKYTLSVEHPAWAYQFTPVIKKLKDQGHQVQILLVEKDHASLVLKKNNLDYLQLADSTGDNLLEKAWLFISLTLKYWFHSFKFGADIYIGRASPMLAIVAFLRQKPHIIFEDTEVSTLSLIFCRWFSKTIVTPKNFQKDLGKKQLRIASFKELFYLHPSTFNPDPTVLKKYHLENFKRLFLVRFVSWKASHDIGRHGLSDDAKLSLVQFLSQKGKVILSSEAGLPESLKEFYMPIEFTDLHHILYHCDLYVGEGATMASEAVALGTHAIYLNSTEAGSIEEQSKYDLLFHLKNNEQSPEIIALCEKLLVNPHLWKDGKAKGEKYRADQISPVDFYMEKI